LREHFYVVESGALAKRFGAVTAFPVRDFGLSVG
jgi:hypothetical protein